jgi:hypothetical protein
MTEKKADEKKPDQPSASERQQNAIKPAPKQPEDLEDIELDDIEEVETKAFA